MTLIPLLALVACYGYWLMSNTHARAIGVLASAVLLVLFLLLGIRFIPQWIGAWSGEPEAVFRVCDGRRSARRQRMHPFFKIILAVLLTRLLLFGIAYLITAVQQGLYRRHF